VSTFSESFSDEPFLCQDELYAQTVSGHSLFHFAFFPDTGAFHLHEDVHGKAVAAPFDGTGPTYTANFWFSDTETIRAVKSGDLLVEQDTDFNHVVACAFHRERQRRDDRSIRNGQVGLRLIER
jgi:hypothetical protein